ncbi:MAG: ABC transporter permease [Dehalococcoidia bacterium]|nr:ABC transporter permease [Dehalococcoidia bacterium]
MLLPLVLANLKMVYRNRQALFWAMVFPLIFVVVFGLFRFDEPLEVNLLVVDQARDPISQGIITSLSAMERFNVAVRQDEAEVRRELEDGNGVYVMIIPEGLGPRLAQGPGAAPAEFTLLYDRGNQTAPIVIGAIQRFIEETNKELVQSPTLLTLRPEGVQSRQFTYFDFVLPGLVGMGVMTYSIIGVASVIALYREQKILKRILATPLRVRTFFAAQIISQLLLSVLQAIVILAAGMLLFKGHVYGNFLWLLVLVVMANVVFLNLGFIVGALAKNVRAADGLANAVSMPMMFLSGTFFPNENLPKVIATVVEYLPLSPLLDAMRGVALDAKPFWAYPTELAILAGWIAVTSVLTIKLFRFE